MQVQLHVHVELSSLSKIHVQKGNHKSFYSCTSKKGSKFTTFFGSTTVNTFLAKLNVAQLSDHNSNKSDST